MAQDPSSDIHLPDISTLPGTLAEIADQSQRLVNDFLAKQVAQGHMGMADSSNLGQAFMQLGERMMQNPVKLAEASFNLWQGYVDLWHSSAASFFGLQVDPAVEPERSDKRFAHDAWRESFVFDYIKQTYLLTARWLQNTVAEVEGLDDKTQKKVEFFTRQFIDALSPTNFPITNPEVLKSTVESGGQNLVQGLKNLLTDLERGDGKLAIKMTDLDAFKLGENIATTPGKVVFQNDLIQLIQYAPTTKEVYQRPLLIVPPWINKYYILDLRPKNSFIKWAVDQGHTVFVISWVNPDARLAQKNFEDYLLEGTIAALDAIAKATGEPTVNAIGYCLGGTLLACTLAYLTAKGDQRIKSATFFTTMLDFSSPGELEVFIDEDEIQMLEERMSKVGYLEGSDMATTFSMLRANDLIWSFFINNYLLGKDPFPFDLLFWNSDSTRMPAAMHSFYLRNMYQENRLREPGGLTLSSVPIDLGSIKTPAYFLSTIEDHIAPWKSTFDGARLFAGPVKFVLGGSGHIAGVVNPPAAGKYCYWTQTKLADTADAWFKGAKQYQGSWWDDWRKWCARRAGSKIAARKPGSKKLPAIEDAPGSYAKVHLHK